MKSSIARALAHMLGTTSMTQSHINHESGCGLIRLHTPDPVPTGQQGSRTPVRQRTAWDHERIELAKDKRARRGVDRYQDHAVCVTNNPCLDNEKLDHYIGNPAMAVGFANHVAAMEAQS